MRSQWSVLLLSLTVASCVAQTSSDGYTNYDLKFTGDSGSTVYDTASTTTSPSDTLSGPPDVYLNASVSVGEIDIEVQNLTAKINLDAEVLNLLQFNAGVDLSVDRVALVIQNVTAKVLLEARLGNLVSMVTDVLSSVDLNPVIATLGQVTGDIGNTVGSALGDVGSTVGSAVGGAVGDLGKRNLIDGILYSVNDYTGNTHRNRVLLPNGDVVDQHLDNTGRVQSTDSIGNYASLFTATGVDLTTSDSLHGTVTEREYAYHPFVGLSVVAVISFDSLNQIVASRILSEVSAGGSSSVSS